MRRRLGWLFPALALGALAGCAHGLGRAHSDGVLHLRTLVGKAADGALVEAELLQIEGDPARLRLSWLRSGDPRESIAELPAALAREIAAAVTGGAALRPLLSPDLLGPWLPEGVSELDDPAGCPIPQGGEALPEGRGWHPSPAGGAWRLVVVRRSLPRFGRAWSALLRHEPERGTAQERILARFPAARATIVHLEGDLAVIATCTSEGPFRTADRIPLDLAAGAVELFTGRAEALLDQGRLEEAVQALEQAEAFQPELPHFHFQRARSLVRQGGDPGEVLSSLERAIEGDPPRYRMEARIAPDFDPLRGDPAFLALTSPRPLPGTNRAGTPPPEPPEPPLPEELEEPPLPEEEPAEPPPIELPPAG